MLSNNKSSFPFVSPSTYVGGTPMDISPEDLERSKYSYEFVAPLGGPIDPITDYVPKSTGGAYDGLLWYSTEPDITGEYDIVYKQWVDLTIAARIAEINYNGALVLFSAESSPASGVLAYNNITGKFDLSTYLSDYTNDIGFITDYTVTEADVVAHEAALSIASSQISDWANLPIATIASLGGIIVGDNLTVDGNGRLSAFTGGIPATYSTITGDARDSASLAAYLDLKLNKLTFDDIFSLDGTAPNQYLRIKFPVASDGDFQAYSTFAGFPGLIWDDMPAASVSKYGGIKITADGPTKYLREDGTWQLITAGTFDHAALTSNMDYATSGHTGFAPTSHTIEGHTATVTSGQYLKGTGTNTFGWSSLVAGDVQTALSNWFTLEGTAPNQYLRCKYPFAGDYEVQAFTDSGWLPPDIWDSLPIATASSLGIMKPGTGLTVTNGVVDVSGVYVADIIEVANYAALPVTGASGKIYVTLDNNLTYRWGGSVYVEISPSVALGTTHSTAFYGDFGQTAYAYSQVGHVPLAGGTMTGNLLLYTSSNIPLMVQSTSTETYINMVSATSDSTYGALLRNTGNDFGIYHTNSVINSIYITGSNRYIGIGIIAPANKIHQDSGTGTATYHQFTAGTTTGQTATDGLLVGIDASGNGIINQQKNLPITLYTNGTKRVTVTAAGVFEFYNGSTKVAQMTAAGKLQCADEVEAFVTF